MNGAKLHPARPCPVPPERVARQQLAQHLAHGQPAKAEILAGLPLMDVALDAFEGLAIAERKARRRKAA